MTAFLAQLAAAEFTRRRAALREAVADRRIDTAKAEANAQCWLAIACAAGADLPEMWEDVVRIFPPGTTARRRLTPDQIAPAKDWRAELTRARDMAVRRALSDLKDLPAQQRSWDLQSLAVNLGCPETTRIDEVEEAA